MTCGWMADAAAAAATSAHFPLAVLAKKKKKPLAVPAKLGAPTRISPHPSMRVAT